MNKKRKMSKYVIVVVVFAFLFTMTIQYIKIQSQINSYEDFGNYGVQDAYVSTEKLFSSVFSDLIYLSDRAEISKTKDFSNLDARTRQLEDFKSFVSRKGIYDQVRYIDKEGNETLRVNYNNGFPIIVDESSLQSKANSYYIKDAYNLDKGQIYISKFDLNKENGKVEDPIKPIIRFVTHYHSPISEFDGFIVFNQFGNQLLDAIKKAEKTDMFDMILLNGDGFYLMGPEKEKDWAFMFDKDEGFYKDFPLAWEEIINSESGEIKTSNGLFTYKSIDPDELSADLNDALVSENDSNRIIIVTHTPQSVFNAIYIKEIIIGILMIIGISTAGIIGVKSYINNKEKEKKYKLVLEENLNKITLSKDDMDKNLTKINEEMNKVTKKIMEGILSTRTDISRVDGQWKDILINVNSIIDAFVDPLESLSTYITKLGRGEVHESFISSHKGEFGEMTSNLNMTISSVKSLVDEMNGLIEGTLEGDLSIRANEDRHNGEYKKIVIGINTILEKMTEPMKDASLVLASVSKGELSSKITKDYHGGFGDIKKSINSTVVNLKDYINEISYVSKEISKKNLSARIKTTFHGDFKEIQINLNNAISEFATVIKQLSSISKIVYTEADGLSNETGQLTDIISSQSSAVEEINISLDGIVQVTNLNVSNFNQIAILSDEIEAATKDSESEMIKMKDAVEYIDISVNNISKIIGLIDGIAFQTNILALNASTEAARAGQAGKGFAVVAGEIRRLSIESSKASKEMDSFVKKTIEYSKQGNKIIEETINSFTFVKDKVNEIANQIDSSKVYIDEQSDSISHIKLGVKNISDTFHTTVNIVDTFGKSGVSLTEKAKNLDLIVKEFEY